jgi:hypothetical protein
VELTLRRDESEATPIRLKAVAKDDAQVEVSADQEIPKGRYILTSTSATTSTRRPTLCTGCRLRARGTPSRSSRRSTAREAFPVLGRAGLQDPIQVTLTVPVADAAIANSLEDRVALHEGKRTTSSRRRDRCPAYLLAVATGPFEFVPIPGTSVPARVVTTKGQSGLPAGGRDDPADPRGARAVLRKPISL